MDFGRWRRIDTIRFEAACRKVREERLPGSNGIGTLGEKTLHAVLKHYYEPDEAKHEVPVAGLVADIQNEEGVIEIQTRGFERLRAKLPRLLAEGPVTVVYPIPATKWLIWVDPDTGEAATPRKSPKRGRVGDIFFEFYKIRHLMNEPGLQFRLLFLDVEEYRLQNGWGNGGKRGSMRQERIPTALQGEVSLGGPHGWGALLPEGLPEAFTCKEYAKAMGVAPRWAQSGLMILRVVGELEQTGKRGREYLYGRVNEGSVKR